MLMLLATVYVSYKFYTSDSVSVCSCFCTPKKKKKEEKWSAKICISTQRFQVRVQVQENSALPVDFAKNHVRFLFTPATPLDLFCRH